MAARKAMAGDYSEGALEEYDEYDQAMLKRFDILQLRKQYFDPDLNDYGEKLNIYKFHQIEVPHFSCQ